jgi:hypothetical protein
MWACWKKKEKRMASLATPGLWERYLMAMDAVTDRLNRITAALTTTSVPYALVGGQAVALWVATKDPAPMSAAREVDFVVNRARRELCKRALRNLFGTIDRPANGSPV